MEEELLKDTYTLTLLTKKLNEVFKCKKNGNPFAIADVQFYIQRGKLPKKLGGNEILPVKNEANLKLYELNPKI